MDTYFCRIALVFAWSFLCYSCSTSPPQLALTYSPDSIWQACQETLESQGYKVAVAGNTKKYLRSEWKTTLAPYQRQGKRTAVDISLEEARDVDNTILGYILKLRIPVEVNYSEHEYMAPDHAVWVANGYDLARERLLLSLIYRKLSVTEKKSR